jgi:GT2 family glycosyltransferase/glycosyltransferase involved in cell wall biosynthesis
VPTSTQETDEQLLRERARDVVLQPAAAPAASIVICAYGQLELTLRCLESIAASPPDVAYEVIVVDDASPDQTRDVLGHVRHVNVLTNDRNLGFLHSANRGAAVASGEYVVMLNNDTEVTAGWLDELVATADDRPDVGIVGCRLVYPDRRLQEAGGIVWADGHGWNYGRGEGPDSGCFSYVREVDYCSGAALLVRRQLWEELGGFDAAFAPAYYEDTDLCFRARERGWKVLYQPRATIFHFEGASHGTDVAVGGKAYQARNHEVFVARWAPQLARQQPNDSRLVLRARDRRPGPRVLVVDDRVPTPDEDSGSQRMWHLLEILDDLGCVVTLLPADGVLRQPWLHRLQQRGVEVLYGPVDPADYLMGMGPELRAVVLSRPANALRFLSLVRELTPHAVVIYDTVDLHFLRLQREAQVATGAATSRLGVTMRALELALASDADVTLAVSQPEREVLLEAETGADVVVVSNIHEALPRPPGPEERSGLLLVGNFQHPPNIDSAQVMVREVMPLVWAARPDTVLRIVGSRMPDEIHLLASERVEVLGWVPDLTEAHDHARVMVAPLRFGAGVKGKVGDALRRGLPVVTSSIGAEGMDLVDGEHALIADGPAATALAVLSLLEDDGLWSRLSSAGIDHVAARLSADNARDALAGALKRHGVLPR